jgi:sugar lactone lactonase YvrE
MNLCKKHEKAPKTLLGESPQWIEGCNLLVYIDIFSSKLYLYSPETEESQEMHFEQTLGFAVPAEGFMKDRPLLIVGLEDRIVEVDILRGEILRTVVSVPEKYCEKWRRFNDAECSPDGVLFSGYLHPFWKEGSKGTYFMVDCNQPNFQLRQLLLPIQVALPNGSAWLNHETFYLVDSGSAEIYQITIDRNSSNEDGVTVLEQTSIFQLSREDSVEGNLLDGMTIDSENHLWIVLCGAGCILRINPTMKKEVYRLLLPFRNPVSCSFGKVTFRSCFYFLNSTQKSFLDRR